MPDHLCPTHDYGVTFERATAIDYRDRRHVFISGTASIDRHGDIVHRGDLERQVERTGKNSEALLAQADATPGDMVFLVVYVRDMADCEAVGQRVRAIFRETPAVIVRAAVCRPGWLVEIEGLAVTAAGHPHPPPGSPAEKPRA